METVPPKSYPLQNMAQFGGLYRQEAKSVSGDHMDDEDVMLIEDDNQLL